MNKFFPIEILREGWSFLKSKSGFTLIAINFGFFLLIGFVTLVSGILILGPAALLLRQPEFISGVLVFLLTLIFIEVVVLFIIMEQFVILVCLHRHFGDQKPLFSFGVFENEMPRFTFYIKCCMFALVKICIGLLMFIWPGIRAFFKYLFIGPIAIFEYKEGQQSEDVLNASAKLTKSRMLHLASMFLTMCLILFFSNLLLGRMVMQLILAPILVTYFTVCVVLMYKKARKI